MDIEQLQQRLAEIENERKWIKRAIKVIEDGQEFQSKPESGGPFVSTTSTGNFT